MADSTPPLTTREPCPYRILDDIGRAFAMGAIGGYACHFVKGIYNSPRGARMIVGAQTARMNTPRTAGSFAVWGGLFSAFDCSMVYLRQKEDPWNSILAGAATGGVLSLRQGLRASARSAAVGGVLLGLIEGLSIMVHSMPSPQILVDDPMGQPGGVQLPNNSAPAPADPSPTSSSWFGNLFGGNKEEEKNSSGANPVILESFDWSILPTSKFK